MLKKIMLKLTSVKSRMGVVAGATLMALTLIVAACSGCTSTVSSSNAAAAAAPTTQANFQVLAMKVNPAIVNPGDEVTVSALISNSGNSDGDYLADLKINGITSELLKVNLTGGTEQSVTFQLSRDIPQIYQVKLGDRVAQFEVSAPGQSSTLATASAPATGGASCHSTVSGSSQSSATSAVSGGANCCGGSSSASSASTTVTQPATVQQRSCCSQ